MRAQFTKFWADFQKTGLSEQDIHRLSYDIIQNIADDDPAWVAHVKQALVNKGLSSQDIERVLLEVKDLFMERTQRMGEKSEKE